MIHVLARVAVEDLNTFLEVFSTCEAALRLQHGSIGSQVFASPADGKRLTILFTWESREAFDGFTADPNVRATMNSSNVYGPPEFTFLNHVTSLPS